VDSFFGNPFLLVAVIALTGGIITLLEKTLPKPEKGEKRKLLYPILAFAIYASSAIFTYFIGTTTQEKSRIQAIKIDSLNNVLLAKQDETINQLTAAKARPMLSLINEDPFTFDVYLLDTSKYSIRNISVTIDDKISSSKLNSGHLEIKDSIKRKKAIDKDVWQQATMGRMGANFAGIVPRQLYFVKQLIVPKNSDINYSIQVIWPDGFYIYSLQCRRTKNGWLVDRNDCVDQISGKPFPCHVAQSLQ
jgi:hypothetical protein